MKLGKIEAGLLKGEIARLIVGQQPRFEGDRRLGRYVPWREVSPASTVKRTGSNRRTVNLPDGAKYGDRPYHNADYETPAIGTGLTARSADS